MHTKAIKVFDEVVGTAAVVSLPALNAFLGSHDKWAFHMVAGPSGAAANVTVRYKHSSDERNWDYKNGTAEIAAQALSTTAQTSKMGFDLGTNVGQGYGQLEVSLSASTARIQIWATGRDN